MLILFSACFFCYVNFKECFCFVCEISLSMFFTLFRLQILSINFLALFSSSWKSQLKKCLGSLFSPFDFVYESYVG